MKKKVLSMLMAAAMVASVLAGCGSSSNNSAATSLAAPAAEEEAAEEATEEATSAEEAPAEESGGDDYFVGLAFGGLDAVPTIIMNFLTEKCEEKGWKYVVTNGDLDVNKYLGDLEGLCQQNPDIILTRVVNDTAVPSALAITTAAGIPAFVISTTTEAEDLLDDPNYLGSVADPELVRGTPLGEWLVSYCEENSFEPKIGIVCGAKSIDARGVCERTIDVVDALDNAGINYDIVADVEADPNWMASGAMKIMEDWIQAYTTDELNTILCWSDEMCVGVVQALQAAGKNPDDYLVLSYDGLEVVWEYVKDGWINACSALQLEQQADAMIEFIQNYKDGNYDKEKDFVTTCDSIYILDSSNIDTIIDGGKPEFYDYTDLM